MPLKPGRVAASLRDPANPKRTSPTFTHNSSYAPEGPHSPAHTGAGLLRHPAHFIGEETEAQNGPASVEEGTAMGPQSPQTERVDRRKR